ncbi:hypothetical protein STEG23_002581, partial [Scotinomys teguina]
MSRPAAPLPPAAAARQGLEAAAARARGAGDMSRRKQSNPRQIKRSLRDMEAREETQAMDISPMEKEAISPEAPTIEESPSPPREDVSPTTVPAPPESPEGPEDMEGQDLEMRPQNEEKEEKEEEAAMASPWSGPGTAGEMASGTVEDRAYQFCYPGHPNNSQINPHPNQVPAEEVEPGLLFLG